jgi:hypothetical protein
MQDWQSQNDHGKMIMDVGESIGALLTSNSGVGPHPEVVVTIERF